MTTTPNGIFVRHADHGLNTAHLALIDHIFETREPGFFVESYELPEDCEDLSCALYGPSVGDDAVGDDEVVYEARGRGLVHPDWLSALIAHAGAWWCVGLWGMTLSSSPPMALRPVNPLLESGGMLA